MSRGPPDTHFATRLRACLRFTCARYTTLRCNVRVSVYNTIIYAPQWVYG